MKRKRHKAKAKQPPATLEPPPQQETAIATGLAVTKEHTMAMGLLVASFVVGVVAVATFYYNNTNSSLENTQPPIFKKKDPMEHSTSISTTFTILRQLPHDPTAFTQGLEWLPKNSNTNNNHNNHNNLLLESTGMYGSSVVRTWDPETSRIHQQHALDDDLFGEGTCAFRDGQGKDRILVLTWKEQRALVLSQDDLELELVQDFSYTTSTHEGWGVTWDPQDNVFYVSDGSDTIAVWDSDFQPIRTVQVSLQWPMDTTRSKVKHINELEWDPYDRTLLANVWYQDVIVRIHPKTGNVVKVYDLSNLYVDRTPSADCLNGIALGPERNQYWVTGKYWPHIYLIELD